MAASTGLTLDAASGLAPRPDLERETSEPRVPVRSASRARLLDRLRRADAEHRLPARDKEMQPNLLTAAYAKASAFVAV